MTTAIAPRKTQVDNARLLQVLERFPKTRVLVIGDFILDQFVWGSVERISPEAPVPVVHVKNSNYMPGGSLNVANNIRTLKGKVFPCGVLGRDLEGRLLLKAIRREGIETEGIISDKARPTTIKTRVIAHSQQVVRFDRENSEAISKEDEKKILKYVQKKIQEIDVIIIEDYGKGVIGPGLLRRVVRLAKKYRKPVLVDPKEKNFSYYKGVTAITPNRKEAARGYENGRVPHHGAPSLQEVGRGLIRKLKCEAVLITLGEDGMALYEKNGLVTQIPTAAREVYDVSGAGDTVIGVFAMALATGAKMREAAIIANLAAGIVVGKIGTATVSPEELRGAIENL